jgi:hypothetical protein
MCGIAGFVTRAPASPPDSVLARMTDSIRHRGPDASGYYRDPFASLGHRRLSIIDVAGGQQPMSITAKSSITPTSVPPSNRPAIDTAPAAIPKPSCTPTSNTGRIA